jgi:hypothetical protein
VPGSLLGRLEHQLDALRVILKDSRPDWLEARPAPDEWSAREHLAHVARHQAVMLERLDRILREDAPALARYRAESDPGWPGWAGLSLEAVRERLEDGRRRLLDLVRSLSPEQASRTGVHPTFGRLGVSEWLEFFLIHEAHHLYEAMVRIGEARRAR